MRTKILHLPIVLFLFIHGFTGDFLYSQELFTGFRSSRILSSYPNRKFPEPAYWIKAGNELSLNFNSGTPSGIWIVSLYWNDGNIGLDFPSDGKYIPFVTFMNTDYSERYLSAFDSSGFKIWLQIEPGAADVDTLIDLILSRYKHHKCIKGFGIDVEWYQAHQNQWGKKISDVESERWEKRVKNHNPDYTLFLKHFSPSWMPPNYRGNIIFVDDSQGFSSSNQMVSEFKSWGAKFAPNKVWFQYGYAADSKIWEAYQNPMKSLGDLFLANIPNTGGLFWVDFTIMQIVSVKIKDLPVEVIPDWFEIKNYPNPFNPTTTFEISLPNRYEIEFIIYDALGRKVKTLFSGQPPSYKFQISWNGHGDYGKISSGAYYGVLCQNGNQFVKRVMLTK